jgi:hypothetical protein
MYEIQQVNTAPVKNMVQVFLQFFDLTLDFSNKGNAGDKSSSSSDVGCNYKPQQMAYIA